MPTRTSRCRPHRADRANRAPGSFSARVRTFSAVVAIAGTSDRLLPDLTAAVDVEIDRVRDALVVRRDVVTVENGAPARAGSRWQRHRGARRDPRAWRRCRRRRDQRPPRRGRGAAMSVSRRTGAVAHSRVPGRDRRVGIAARAHPAAERRVAHRRVRRGAAGSRRDQGRADPSRSPRRPKPATCAS